MATNYKEYLAQSVLTEGKIVTYRLLSRALKEHVNTAKQMLYDFYTKENAKKPKSVHATYLLIGKRAPQTPEHTNGTHNQDGEDSFMQSSPFPSSVPELDEPKEKPVPVTDVILVREEELEKTKAELEEITSIHVYSLEPAPIENMNILSVPNQEAAKISADVDPLQRWQVYGTIHNPYIKRRKLGGAPTTAQSSTSTASKPVPRPSVGVSSKAKETGAGSRRGSTSEDSKSGRSTPQSSADAPLKRSGSKGSLKRDKSDIFKAFAKSKAPKPKETPKAEESTQEDEQMMGMSEDEGPDEDVPELANAAEKAAEERRKRAERKKELDEMMERDDDLDMEDAPPVVEEDSQDAPLDAPASKAIEPESTVTVQGGRRRGRRKVMKKITTKNAKGYLATTEEAVWESFSEDEPEPKKPKMPAKPASTAKGKKGGSGTGKYGQGSIASFFKKA